MRRCKTPSPPQNTKPPTGQPVGGFFSVYVLVDGGVELFDEGIVAGLDRVGDAVLKVILEYNSRRAA